jgi:hypothetical protein
LIGSGGGFGEAEVDDFGDEPLVYLDEHEVCGFDIAVDEVVLAGGVEGAGDLSGDGEG